MRLSKSFIKTLRAAPKEETARGAQYLSRAGYIYKELAGVYDYLPFGLRVLDNIKTVVREELNRIGGEECLMSTLQNPELWIKTDRWDPEKMDIWFRTQLSAGGELGLGPTHEEPFTDMLRNYVSSYRDLPIGIYQIQTKFRNELRAKSGIMRGREFIMKDMYTFCATQEDHDKYYEEVAKAYMRIYDRLGIGSDTYKTFASGGVFSKYSHEFQTLCEVGEDNIYFNSDKSVCLNEEVLIDEVMDDLKVKRDDLEMARAAEVGNIFTLGTKFSGPLGLEFTDKNGERKPVLMGCYGIGISRVMGVIAEKMCDDKGLVWPENIAPYKYYLIGLSEAGQKKAEEIYQGHEEEILFDDRDLHAGEKFADAELIGIPYRIVISDKTLEDDQAEITDRKTGESKFVSLKELF